MSNKQDYIDNIKLIANSINEYSSKEDLNKLIAYTASLREEIVSEDKCLYAIVYDTERNGKSVRIYKLLGKVSYEMAQRKLISFRNADIFGYVCKISEDEWNDFLCLYYLCKIDEYYGFLKQYHANMASDRNYEVLDKIKYFRKKLRLYYDNEYVELDW